MKKKFFICGLSALLIGMVSCKTIQKETKVNDSTSVVSEEVNIVEKYWKLTELFGEPVITSEGGREAYMMLKKEDSRVTGNSGCNTFNGSFTMKPGNMISFSKTISTMMMCVNMDVESKLYQALEMADNYYSDGDKLVLNKARMAPLARFEAVSAK